MGITVTQTLKLCTKSFYCSQITSYTTRHIRIMVKSALVADKNVRMFSHSAAIDAVVFRRAQEHAGCLRQTNIQKLRPTTPVA